MSGSKQVVALAAWTVLVACGQSSPGAPSSTDTVPAASSSANGETTTAAVPTPSTTSSLPGPSGSSTATPVGQTGGTSTEELTTRPGSTLSETASENQSSDTSATAAPQPSTATSSATQGSSDATSDAPEFEGKELFVLFGQSNMSGFTPMLDEPWSVDENITFMVQYDCPRLGQTKDQWLAAEPPLHGCQWATNGLGLGLGDYFGKAMAAAWPDAKIGLIPNAVPAVVIDIFMKGGPSPGGGTKALPDGYTSAYTLMIDRAKEAQKLGRIRGILLNQGESDFNQGFGDEWADKVATLVADLRTDLGLTESVPFIAGEVPPTGNYSGQNANVRQLTGKIPNCAVVTGEGTDVHDGIHYDQASVRLMGERYAAAALQLLAGAP